MTKEGGTRRHEDLTVTIPHDAPTGNYKMQVLGGDFVDPEVAAPVAIADLPKLYDAFYKSTELVALLPTARVDLEFDALVVLLRHAKCQHVEGAGRSLHFGQPDIEIRRVESSGATGLVG